VLRNSWLVESLTDSRKEILDGGIQLTCRIFEQSRQNSRRERSCQRDREMPFTWNKNGHSHVASGLASLPIAETS